MSHSKLSTEILVYGVGLLPIHLGRVLSSFFLPRHPTITSYYPVSTQHADYEVLLLVILSSIPHSFQSSTIDTVAVTIATLPQYPPRNNVAGDKRTGAFTEQYPPGYCGTVLDAILSAHTVSVSMAATTSHATANATNI
jgi:hypothetical protein